MKNTAVIFLIIAGVFLSNNSIQAQKSSFDPYLLEIEFFSDIEVKDGNEFTDTAGNTYKIKNTASSKGLLIKDKGKWKKHGVFFTMTNGRVQSKTNYNRGEKHGYRYWLFNDGTVMSEVLYKNNKKEGLETEYYFNRVVKFKRTWVNGQKQGDVLYYNNKAKLVSKSKWVNHKKVGETQWYK